MRLHMPSKPHTLGSGHFEAAALFGVAVEAADLIAVAVVIGVVLAGEGSGIVG